MPFLQDLSYLLGWEVGHTVGPMLWGWELDVTVHSTFTHGTIMASTLLFLEGIYGAVDNGIVIGDTPQVLCRGEIANSHQLNECN